MKNYHKNPRQIKDKQFANLRAWLAELGDLSGIVHDLNTDEVISGNQRMRAIDIAKCEIVLTEGPHDPDAQGTVAHGYVLWQGAKYNYRQVHWTAEQCEKANIVANKAGGTWDFDILANEWEKDDLLEWGFELEELGMYPDDDKPDDPGAQIDRAEELREKWGVETGQLWQLGEHRLICGDCTDAAVVARVMGGEKAALMVTDPPYGVDYDPMFRQEALGAAVRRAGRVQNDTRADWQDAWKLFSGDVVYCWSGMLTALEVLQSFKSAGFCVHAEIVWSKPHLPFGRGHYVARHESCWYLVRNGKTAQWSGEGIQTTVWDIALDATAEGGHGTQKPIECMERPIRNHDAPIVYDPFLGSGTTMVAAHRLNRRCFGIEIDAGYAAVTLQRMSDMGVEPVLLEPALQ